MSAKKTLELKALVSFFYLLFAMACFLLPFLFPDTIFYVYQYVSDGANTIKSFNWRTLIIWIAGILYALDFFYGAIHYPRLYLKALSDKRSREIEDNSAFRGYWSLLFVLGYGFFSIFSIVNANTTVSELMLSVKNLPIMQIIIVLFVLISIHVVLAYFSQTSRSFKHMYTVIDISAMGVGDEKGLHKVHYYLPVKEKDREQEFAVQAATAYVLWKKEDIQAKKEEARQFDSEVADRSLKVMKELGK